MLHLDFIGTRPRLQLSQRVNREHGFMLPETAIGVLPLGVLFIGASHA